MLLILFKSFKKWVHDCLKNKKRKISFVSLVSRVRARNLGGLGAEPPVG